MVSLTLMATVMICFIGTFVQSRRITESSVLHAAATSMVYGIVEQIKQLDYSTLLPNDSVDPAAAASGIAPPYVRVRISQDKLVWLRVVYQPVTDEDPATADIPTPKGPLVTPAPTDSPESVGAIDNYIGNIPLSTVTGTTSQQINLNIWLWIDGIPYADHDVSEVKKITLVYTYSYIDGASTRIIRDREVFLRTRYDQ